VGKRPIWRTPSSRTTQRAAFDELMTALSKPYEDRSEFSKHSDPPPPNRRVYQTFFGT
jgi:hypothetical protein